MKRYKSTQSKCINTIGRTQQKFEKQLTQSEFRQLRRLLSYINYRKIMHYRIPNPITEGRAFEVTEVYQNKPEVMENYFVRDFTRKPPSDKELDPSTN